MEALVTITILLIISSALMELFVPAFRGTEVSTRNSTLLQQGRAKMEEMLAMPFEDIPLGSPLAGPYSDTVSYNGKNYPRQVSVSLVDGDSATEPGFGEDDTTLKQVSVSVDGIVLAGLKTDF